MTTSFLERNNLLMPQKLFVTKEFKSKPGAVKTGTFRPIIKGFFKQSPNEEIIGNFHMQHKMESFFPLWSSFQKTESWCFNTVVVQRTLATMLN